MNIWIDSRLLIELGIALFFLGLLVGSIYTLVYGSSNAIASTGQKFDTSNRYVYITYV